MKKLFFVFLLLLLSLNVFAVDPLKEHTVVRGETLTSIAKLYNITPEDLLEANPMAKEMFYTGMVLVIPEANTVAVNQQTTTQTIPSAVQTLVSGDNTSSEYNPFESINGWYLSYNANFDSFSKGWYGIGYQFVETSGFGGTFSIHGCWGLIDPGQLMFKFGPMYGARLHENITLSALLRGFIYTYDKINKKGHKDTAVNGGITLTPTLYFNFDKLFIGLGYELGWCNDYNELYHNAEFKIGLNL